MPKPVTPKTRIKAEMERRRREYVQKCIECRHDPVRYVTEILRQKPTIDQERMLEAIEGNRRVAVKACHAAGKTITAAWASSWWYDCQERSIVYITAPTWPQALGLTFKQLKLIRNKHVPAHSRGVIMESGKIVDPDKTNRDVHFVKALNAETGEGFQGEHSAPMLVIFDEATAVPAYIYDATKVGLMTYPDNRHFVIGNPTNEATPYGAVCRNVHYNTLTISVFDHPNIDAEMAGEEPPVPDAVRLIWLYEMLRDETELAMEGEPDAFEFYSLRAVKAALDGSWNSTKPWPESWGPLKQWYRPNAVFQGRGLGMFPTESFQQVIPRGWLEAGQKSEPAMDELPEIGIDSARHGDDRTVYVTRHSYCVLDVRTLRQMDQDVVLRHAREVIRFAARDDGRNYDPKAIPVRFDVTGGLGTGPADTLIAEGYNVECINSSFAAYDDETYPNRRSELWFACRELARQRRLDLSRLSPDFKEAVIVELSTPKWQPDKKGRKDVETKKDIKKLLKWSPDIGDAVNLAFASPMEPRILESMDSGGLDRRWTNL